MDTLKIGIFGRIEKKATKKKNGKGAELTTRMVHKNLVPLDFPLMDFAFVADEHVQVEHGGFACESTIWPSTCSRKSESTHWTQPNTVNFAQERE